MDKMAIARRKCARGAVLTLLFGNPRAAVMQRTLEYALMQDDPQAANEIGSHIYYLADKGYVKCYLGDEVLSSYRTRRGRRRPPDPLRALT